MDLESELLTLGDSHCHLSVEMTLAHVPRLAEQLNGDGYASGFFNIMSTNHIDLEILAELVARVQNKVVRPYWGVHPWYSHLFTVFEGSPADIKVKHYRNILRPEPSPQLLQVLPEPIHIDSHLRQITRLVEKFPGVGFGVGEIGLDKLFRVPSNGYYGNQQVQNNGTEKLSPCRVTMQHQQEILNRQLALAAQLRCPVSVHCVKAHGPLFETLTEKFTNIPTIILHSFSGSPEQALRWTKHFRGRQQQLFFSLSYYINGVEDRADSLERLLRVLGPDQVLIETDISVDKHLAADYMDHLQGIFEQVCKLDDVDEFWLQRSTSDQEAVDVGLILELGGVLAVDRASVQDLDLGGLVSTDGLGQVFSDTLVGFLSVFWGGGQTSTDGPDRLVGNNNVGPVRDDFGNSVQLSGANVQGNVGLSLLQGLTNTQDDREALVQGELGLFGDELVGLLDNGSSFRVAGQGPLSTQVQDLVGGNLTGVGTRGLGVDVLGRDLDGGLLVGLDGQSKVRSWRSNHHLDVLGQVCGIQVLNDLGDGLLGSVHFEVTSDEELTSHDVLY